MPNVGEIYTANDPRAQGRRIKIEQVLVGDFYRVSNVDTGRVTQLHGKWFRSTGRNGFTLVGAPAPDPLREAGERLAKALEAINSTTVHGWHKHAPSRCGVPKCIEARAALAAWREVAK